MPGKTYIKKTLFTCALLCLFAILLGTLPEIWFHNHLKKNWNVEENTLAGTKNGRRYRLCLVLALDGVPYTMLRDLRKEGYFNGFYPPGRLVSTFPSLTRPAFSKMLIGGKPFGYERLYYNFDTNQLQGATLIQKALSTQKEHADYHPKLHFLGFPGYIAYVFPDTFTQTALDAFKTRLKHFKGDEFIAYMGISDAIAHVEGEAALNEFLKKVSDLLDTVRNDIGILLDVVLFSDHANNFTQNRRVDLSTPLVEAGFKNTDQLEERKDFVLPENGLVSFAAIYSAKENAPAIAAVLSTIEGVDFSVYRSGVSLLVQGAKGTARISKRQNRFLYSRIDADPLDLKDTILRLKYLGEIDPQGFIHEKAWWMATKGHLYPDPLKRIWEGMNDLVQHPATVLVSLRDGYAFGPPIFDQPIIDSRAGTHGALLASHSYGFLMTDFMHVKDASRPAEVAGLLGRAAEAKKKGQKLVGVDVK